MHACLMINHQILRLFQININFSPLLFAGVFKENYEDAFCAHRV